MALGSLSAKLTNGSWTSATLNGCATPGDDPINHLHLFYDERDDAVHEARGSQILYWLDDLGAKPLGEADPAERGVLFAGARPIDDYRQLIGNLPLILDRAEQREPLLYLHTVLERLLSAKIDVPAPRTWLLPIDVEIPADLEYPLFLRTSLSSFKLGGKVSRVQNREELESEMEELRRAFGWDALILARRWHDFAEAGQGTYGPIPQEVRTWIVDFEPIAWSFHYSNILETPKGFPPTPENLRMLARFAERIATAFGSRCIVADFARERTGEWLFIEAGPGSCAGTANEEVFKAVAGTLRGETVAVEANPLGGLFS